MSNNMLTSKPDKRGRSGMSKQHWFKKGHSRNVREKHPRWKGLMSKLDNGKTSPIYQRRYKQRIRLSILAFLGNRCSVCEFSDIRALQIDHINGGGSKERKEKNYIGYFYKHVMNSILKKENKYQILCANCNWIKRFENNEVRGRGKNNEVTLWKN